MSSLLVVHVVGLCCDFRVLCCGGLAVLESSLGSLLRARGVAGRGRLSRECAQLVVWCAREARECLSFLMGVWWACVVIFARCAAVVWLFSRVLSTHSCAHVVLPAGAGCLGNVCSRSCGGRAKLVSVFACCSVCDRPVL